MVSNNTNLNTIERDQTPYYQYYDPNPTYYYEYYDPDSNVSDGNSQPPQGWPVVETQTFEQNYLYENQNINENINLEATLLGHTHRPDPTPSQQSANAKLALMSKVYDKLGEEKLKEIFKKQDIAIYTTIRELLDDCLNKFYRLFGLGYEFSDKEAREAIAGLHDPTKTFFGFDNNTRFAQVANEQGIIMQEGSVILYKEQNEEADLSNQDSDEEMRENLPHPEESGDFTPQQHSELNIEEELNIKEDVPFAAEAEDSNKLDLQLPENVEAQANFRVLIEQQKQDILAEQPFTL